MTEPSAHAEAASVLEATALTQVEALSLRDDPPPESHTADSDALAEDRLIRYPYM